jgi:ATP-binding cassette subfamily E protein 1
MKIENKELFIVNSLPVNINVDLKEGLYLLVGENGVGKTSFFNYLKEHKENLSPKSRFAFMDQFPLSAINEIRLTDILKLLESSKTTFDLKKANHFIDKYQIRYLLDRPLIQYSGGENQVVKFIILICQDVEFYFLDEPLQYIDKKRIVLLKEDIAELAKRKTIVIIEHRAHELEELNPYMITMEKKGCEVIINGH